MKAATVFMAWWQARLQRERMLIGVAAALVAAVLAATLVEWVLHERARLRRALPAAEVRVAWMQEAAAELAGLRGHAPATPLDPAAQADAVQASARARGFEITVRAESGGIQFAGNLPFDAGMTWLADLQREQHLHVAKAEFMRIGGSAKIEALLVAAGDS